jgi:lactoylglutathione lyase
MSTMDYAYTILYVSDVEASIAFCEKAFGLARAFVHESGAYGELATGNTKLAFVDHATARDSVGGAYVVASDSPLPLGIEVGFTTADVPAAFARAVAAGATSVSPPAVKPWGQTVAYVRCPDGLLVELCTPMGG